VVLIDVGSTTTPIVQRFWFAAHDIVLVTTPDTGAIMDCYATVKNLLTQGADPESLRLIVNRVDSDQAAKDVFRRLAQSSARFLGREIEWLGAVKGQGTTAESPSVVLAGNLTDPPEPMDSAIKAMACHLTVGITARLKNHVA
jgi:flagellar biosynthesis protein FlhG